jgi:hypothetical protein
MTNQVHPIFEGILAAIAPKARKVQHSYFVVMQDFGKLGLEATVQPEITRREIVSRLKTGEYKNVSFIHHVEGGLVEDVTGDLIDEAEALAREEAR